MVSFLPVFLVLVSSLIGAVGTLLIKKGTNKHTFFVLLRSKYLWIGFFTLGPV